MAGSVAQRGDNRFRADLPAQRGEITRRRRAHVGLAVAEQHDTSTLSAAPRGQARPREPEPRFDVGPIVGLHARDARGDGAPVARVELGDGRDLGRACREGDHAELITCLQ
jgi:hypothetical protein